MTDWRDLPPVAEGERNIVRDYLLRHDRPDGVFEPTVKFLQTHDRCHRAAHLSAKYGSGPGTHEMNRGTIVHIALDRLTNLCIDRDEQSPDPDTGKRVVNDVMREHPELTVPAHERDACRYMVDHFCRGTYWAKPREQIIGVELELELPILGGRFVIRGRLDLVEQPSPYTLDVVDYKTSFAMPEKEEWATGGLDENGNPRFGGNMQTQLGALLLRFGMTPDGLQIPEAERYRMFLRFPRFLDEEGLKYREAEISTRQLDTFYEDVETQAAQVVRGMETGKWQPTPGSHCGECPSEVECPLPRHLRAESQLNLATVEDLERMAANRYFMQRRSERLIRRIRKRADQLGLEMVYAGSDVGFKFVPKTTEKIVDRIDLRYSIEEAVNYGRGLAEDGTFPWEKHTKTSHGVSFEKRKLPKRDDYPTRKDTDG